MKLLSLIISIYILFMVSMPCMDGVSCIFENHTEQTSHQDHSDDTNPVHGCSPFCICTCCSVHVVINGFNFISSPYIFSIAGNIPQNQVLTSFYYQHIWQPPKIG